MVTHDRYFLERVCNGIFELDGGKLYKYRGNYSEYLRQKELRFEIFEKSVVRAQTIVKKELKWISRQPKARGSKSKLRKEEFHKLKEHAETKLQERMVQFEVEGRRIGKKILNLHGISKSFGGTKLIENFEYKFKRGDRVGIVGKNGSGKTTFLNIITGNLEPDSGSVEKGQTIVFGYYNQNGIEFNEEKKVIEAVKEVAEVIEFKNGNFVTASQMLERFLFPASTHYVKIKKLSGGEKRRLYLLTILMQNPNFLILDEPTNDLDILTLNILEDFLLEYKGCLLIVSHDRYFIDKLVDHLFIFEGGGKIRDFTGNYSLYQAEKELFPDKIEERTSKKEKVERANPKKRRFGFKEKRRYEELEREIEILETEKKKLHEEINSCGSDYVKLERITSELDEIEKKLDSHMEEFIELMELMEEN
jgi:ATP-binding cassette subfamily F protein uup